MKRSMILALYAALLVSIGTDILLLRTNHLLTTQIKSLQHTDGPAIGQRILSLNGTDLLGNPVRVGTQHAASKTLILAFTPTCPYCQANWPFWVSLSGSLRGKDSLVWADLSGTAKASDIAQYGIPVEQDSSLRVGTESRDICALHVTPTTVLLDERGEVEKVWLGLLDKDKVTEILHFAS